MELQPGDQAPVHQVDMELPIARLLGDLDFKVPLRLATAEPEVVRTELQLGGRATDDHCHLANANRQGRRWTWTSRCHSTW